jgi:hypothetical protein
MLLWPDHYADKAQTISVTILPGMASACEKIIGTNGEKNEVRCFLKLITISPGLASFFHVRHFIE